jgi:cytochrome b561
LNLPSFIWLWRVAAWSMGLSILCYLLLATTGIWLFYGRETRRVRPGWLRPLHYGIGICMVTMVILLLAIGLVGTIGEYGRLGHSLHLPIGLAVVALTLLSAWSATQIGSQSRWARILHRGVNFVLLLGFITVSLTGWSVVQKYLP